MDLDKLNLAKLNPAKLSAQHLAEAKANARAKWEFMRYQARGPLAKLEAQQAYREALDAWAEARELHDRVLRAFPRRRPQNRPSK